MPILKENYEAAILDGYSCWKSTCGWHCTHPTWPGGKTQSQSLWFSSRQHIWSSRYHPTQTKNLHQCPTNLACTLSKGQWGGQIQCNMVLQSLQQACTGAGSSRLHRASRICVFVNHRPIEDQLLQLVQRVRCTWQCPRWHGSPWSYCSHLPSQLLRPFRIARSLIIQDETLVSWRNGLGKYSKMKIGIFCIHRPEALGPPPLRVQFCGKKLTPIFFLEIESMIAKTNFTLGPIEKSISLVQL